MPSLRLLGGALALGFALVSGGCGSHAKPSTDARSDAKDAKSDAGDAPEQDTGDVDAAAEAPADGPADAPQDVAADAAPDVADATPDSPADVAADAGPDATPDAPDGGADAIAEAPAEYDAGAGCVGSVETPLVPADSDLPATGLVLWVRADRGIYKTAQNAVCAWRDQSGHSNDLHPASARPTWEAAAVGGKPAVHNAAVGQEMAIGSVLGIGATSARTFIAVSMLATPNGRFHPIIQGQVGTPGTYAAIDANTWMTAGSREGAYLTANSFDTATPTSTSPRLHVLTISTMTPGASIATSLGYRVDGAAQTLTLKAGLSGGVIQSFANANFTSIGVVSGTPSAGVAVGNGYIAEAIAYDRLLNAAEIAAVEAALKARYGIP
jgi:hypothetical protein